MFPKNAFTNNYKAHEAVAVEPRHHTMKCLAGPFAKIRKERSKIQK